MDLIKEYNEDEQVFIINIGIFLYTKHNTYFKNKLNNSYLLNNLEQEFNNTNIELISEIEQLKEKIKNDEINCNTEKQNLNNEKTLMVNKYQTQYNELINEKNKELTEERNRNFKIQQEQKQDFREQFDKLNTEKLCLINNYIIN